MVELFVENVMIKLNMEEIKKYDIEKIKNTILNGDALSELKKFPDDSIDVVITSPPYFSLRNYLPKNHPDKHKEIGTEKTIDEYIINLVEIFDEVNRVLKNEGSFYLNIADSYASRGVQDESWKNNNKIAKKIKNADGMKRCRINNYPSKCLCMVPERLAIKLIEHEWILRNKIVWAKSCYIHKDKRVIGNAMPTSVRDRYQCAYENLYFFTKSQKYYFNLDAIRIPQQNQRGVNLGQMQILGKGNPEGVGKPTQPPTWFRGNFEKNSNYNGKFNNIENAESYGSPRARTQRTKFENHENLIKDVGVSFMSARIKRDIEEGKEIKVNLKGRNIPDVWQINTHPSSVPHYAQYPMALLENPIRASCPENGIVLDLFAGVCTTALMAYKLNRNWIMVELDKRSCELGEQQIKEKCHPELDI